MQCAENEIVSMIPHKDILQTDYKRSHNNMTWYGKWIINNIFRIRAFAHSDTMLLNRQNCWHFIYIYIMHMDSWKYSWCTQIRAYWWDANEATLNPALSLYNWHFVTHAVTAAGSLAKITWSCTIDSALKIVNLLARGNKTRDSCLRINFL